MDGSTDEVVVTGDNLRGLVHPLRMELLGLLRTYGPATATGLARRLDTTSGSISYHLRQLARYGFIVEDTSRGNQRERWWKAAHRSSTFTGLDGESAAAGLGDAYEHEVVAGTVRALLTADSRRDQITPEWRRVQDVSDFLLVLTPEQAGALAQELIGVIRSYPQNQPDQTLPEGSGRVSVRYQLLPLPEDPAEGPPVGAAP